MLIEWIGNLKNYSPFGDEEDFIRLLFLFPDNFPLAEMLNLQFVEQLNNQVRVVLREEIIFEQGRKHLKKNLVLQILRDVLEKLLFFS